MKFPLLEGIPYFITPECAPTRVFDVWGERKTEGTNVVIHSRHGGDNQRFVITLVEEDYFTITDKNSLKVLDAEKNENGAKICIRNFTGSPSQLWKLKEAGNGYYVICSKLNENYCMDVANGRDADSTKIQMHIWTDNPAQRFRFTPYEFINLHENYQSIYEKAHKMKTALTIAGSDSSGGAGIQADIKTMTANGVFAMSAITALTAQNTMGVTGIMDVTPDFLAQQLDCVFTDIVPDAVKIGMVSSCGLIEMIAEKLVQYQARNIVLDPVMVATSGSRLISEDAIETLKSKLIPLADIITPNIPEAEELTGVSIQTVEDMERVAEMIYEKYHCAVLLKGGHSLNDANDFLCWDGGARWFEGKRIQNPNAHGTGCTLSSAIASNLAKGFPMEESVDRAKRYISGALGAMLDLGKGSGPMNHAFAIENEFTEEYTVEKETHL